MASITQSTHQFPLSRWLPFWRRLLLCASVVFCGAVLLQAFAVEAFNVPTGSMAPSLLGYHRVCLCPRCGQEVTVGRHALDISGTGASRFYRKSFCPNCGLSPLPVEKFAEVRGDQLRADRTAFLLRKPSRWEIVVFRLLGNLFIKRILGLPGEEIYIHDGDFYVNGRLCRKTLEEARRMRVLVFDQAKAPPGGWGERWVYQPEAHATASRNPWLALGIGQQLTYRHYLLDEQKCEPIRDEYAYNGGVHADAECVHDFMIDTDIEPIAGRGSVALRLCDGQDWVEVRLPVGDPRLVEVIAWPTHSPSKKTNLARSEQKTHLRAKQRHRIELAFVDRRVSLAIDGKLMLDAELPEPGTRNGVSRPFQATSDGVQLRFHSFRLYRDLHYGQHGKNGVHGKSVRLSTDQYFMLGDNSANSEDSRYWNDDGRVSESSLIGLVRR